MRKLKRTHKNLMIIEAGFIYCKRNDIEFDIDNFIDNIFMTDEFHDTNNEFDSICDDLRCYRYYEKYKLKVITEEEYESCVDMFGEI
jgi:hypothetical protein